jgi:hypothetical protein
MTGFGLGRAAPWALGALVAVAMFAAAPAGARAGSAIKLCVPRQEGRPLLTPKRGACRRGYRLRSLGAEGRPGAPGAPSAPGAEGKPGAPGAPGAAPFTTAEVEQLKALLPYVELLPSGVDAKPTVVFHGVNVQVVNGLGSTAGVNGLGNVVIGYDENTGSHAQTGSHDLVLGEEQTFTSYAGIVAGQKNAISAPFASVAGGWENLADGEFASVAGGRLNHASDLGATVSGGAGNHATGPYASVSGGENNVASGQTSSVGGGLEGSATAFGASVSGGRTNQATGEFSSVTGGRQNVASGLYAAIFGGKAQEASAEDSFLP